jgi:hypothetical protein
VKRVFIALIAGERGAPVKSRLFFGMLRSRGTWGRLPLCAACPKQRLYATS